ncbi:marvel domain-containing protein [Terfezia claveryi]|nr:marvel domain-containing protein [Terfezia claveryi]
MGYLTNAILRILQFGITILTLGLSATLPTQQSSGGSPTRVNFTIFACSFALLTLLYLLPVAVISNLRSRFYHPFISFVLDLLNFIFFLSAAIALAAQLGAHNCSNRIYLVSNGITNGGGYWNMEKRCREAQALTAFMWLAIPLWIAGAVVSAYEYLRGKDGRHSGRGGLGRTVRPVRGMSQV